MVSYTYDASGEVLSISSSTQNEAAFENHPVQHGDVKAGVRRRRESRGGDGSGVITIHLVNDVSPTDYVQTLDEIQSGAVVRS
jgi:hypothetical protein